MPFVVRASDAHVSPDGAREVLLAPGQLPDDRLQVEIVTLGPSDALPIHTAEDELVWIQLLSGACLLDDDLITTDWVAMLARGAGATLVARESTRAFVARVPRAGTYDPSLATGTRVLVDWATEPVLDSEHDARQRIYLASPGLWGTDAVKGEMIIYPPGSSGAAHHHEGAEHFQFIVAGSGTAVLDGEEVRLDEGDLLYNLERELHWFSNDTTQDMVFVEFFVPGRSTTVWAPGANACGWAPTGHDIKGREPSRRLEYHIHGHGDV